MAVLDILTYPNPHLKEVAEPVVQFDAAVGQLVTDLEETMAAGPRTVGIAAPQVGRLLRVCIVDVSGRKKTESHGHLVLVNPEILEWDGFEVGREGCLSVPDYTGNVVRAETIRLTAQDATGAPRELSCRGFEARAIQHEIDHLDGTLFLDRLVSRRSDLFRRKVYAS